MGVRFVEDGRAWVGPGARAVASSRPSFARWGPITGLLALATLLAFWDLGGKSLWLDEALTVEFASMSWGELWDFWLNEEIGMGPYYAVLKVWAGVFGTSEASVRALSVLPALGSVWATWRIGVRWFGERAGLAAALVLAVSPVFVAFAQEARAYAMVLFLVTASTLALLRAVEHPTVRRWLVYTGLTVLAIYVHLFAGLVMSAHLVYLLWVRRGLRWKPMTVSAAEGALLLVPIAVFMVRVGSGYLSWIPPRDFTDLPLFFQFLSGHNVWLFAAYALAVGIGLAWAASAWGLPELHRRAESLTVAVAWLLLPVLIATVVSMMLQPLLLSRYLLFSLPALALLVGAGAAHAHPRWLGEALLTVVVAVSAWGVVDYYGSPKENWRGAAEYISEDGGPSDAVLVYEGFVDAPLEYYLEQEPREAVPRDLVEVWDGASSPAPESLLADLAADHERVWLVLSNNFDASYTERLRAAIDVEYEAVDEKAFVGVRVVRYER